LPTDVEAWATEPRCGAVVSFRGTVRAYAEGRSGVETLTYEAYEDVALARLDELVAAARRRWPDLGRIAVLHRVGTLAVTDAAVLVVVAAGHRTEAFEAARWLIDSVKATVPIWKHERWADGSGWGTGAQPLVSVESLGGPSPAASREGGEQ
jgi:molybdopterin synthase catalytic subunit